MLGKVFGAFESCAVAAGTDDKELTAIFLSFIGESLAYAENERVFVAYDNKIDIVLAHCSVNGIEIGGIQRQVGAVNAGAGIAGGDEKLAHAGALAQFPGYCGFATAAAEQKHVNSFHYILCLS